MASREAESRHSDAECGPDYHTLAFLLYSVDRVFLLIFFFFFLKQRSWLLASQLTSPSSQTAPKPNPEGGSPGERVCGGDRNGARSTGEVRRRMGATGRAAESAEASGTWLYWAGRRRVRGHRDGERLANVLRRKTEKSVFFLSQVRASESGQIGRGSQRGTKVRKTRFAPGNILLRDRFMSEHRHVSLRECPGLSVTAPRPHAVGDVRNSAGLRARQSRKLL